MGLEYYRNGKANEQEVSHSIAHCGRHQLRDAFPALSTWIRRDLPVVPERVTLAEGGDDHGHEGHDEEVSDNLET